MPDTRPTVRLRAYGGEIIERCVVRVDGCTVVVSTAEELDAAEREGRTPIVVGFPLCAVVDDSLTGYRGE